MENRYFGLFKLIYTNGKEIIQSVKLFDFILASLLPLIITFVFLLPISIKQNLLFDTLHPKFWQFFTASYTHVLPNHYIQNLTGFLLIIYFEMLLFSYVKKQGQFRILVGIGLFIYPFVESLLYFYVSPIRSQFSMGSSGIVSYFYGLAFFSCCFYLASKHNLKKWNYFLFLLVLAYPVLFFGYHYLGFQISLIWVAAILLLVFLFIMSLKSLLRVLKSYWIEFGEHPTSAILILICLTLFFSILSNLFPLNFRTSSGDINIYIHYAGYLIGVVVSEIILKLKI